MTGAGGCDCYLGSASAGFTMLPAAAPSLNRGRLATEQMLPGHTQPPAVVRACLVWTPAFLSNSCVAVDKLVSLTLCLTFSFWKMGIMVTRGVSRSLLWKVNVVMYSEVEPWSPWRPGRLTGLVPEFPLTQASAGFLGLSGGHLGLLVPGEGTTLARVAVRMPLALSNRL